MKTNYIYVAVVALAMMAASCSDDQLVQIQESAPNGHQVRVTASMEAESRLAITDTGKRLEFTWEDDDVFHVFDPANQQTTKFTKEADASAEPSPYGTFVGTPQVAYQDGDKLYAVYNQQHGELQLDENGNVTLDISGQTGKLEDRFQFMYAESTFSEGEKPAFAFKHLVTMVKLNITVPEDVTILKEIHLNTNSLPTRATLLLKDAPYDSFDLFETGDLISCYNNSEGGQPLVVEGEFTPVDGVVTVYMYVFPVKQYHENHDWYDEPLMTPGVWAVDDVQNEYVGIVNFDDKEIVAGKTYQLNTDVYELEPFANETTVDGSKENPYEIATVGQLYTFMYRSSREMSNSEGTNYSNCSYKLTSDIQLNGEFVWKPATLSNATFDGQGHTISGKLDMHAQGCTGLFHYISHSTVQNLTLNLEISFDNESNEEWFGTLVGNSFYGTFIHCVNHSNVSGHFYRMGGLAGYIEGETKFLACANTGTLTALNENRQMGGIVAEMKENTIIEGCYNTGTFNVNTVYWEGIQAGGICGTMNTEYSASVQNCWSNSSLTIENVIYDDNYVNTTNNIFMGAIVGYQLNGTVSNCYWNEAVDYAAGNYEDASVTGGGSFSTATPTSAQIQALNNSMSNSDWLFQNDGTLKMNENTSLPSWGKDNFGNN